MGNIFYFTGGGSAHQHYIDTIIGSVELGSFENRLTIDQKRQLQEAYRGEPIRVWGAVPGPSNTRNWSELRTGDIVLVYKDGEFTHAGHVALKFRNEALAEKFWGRDDQGNTWELIYFLKDISEINLPVEVFNEKVGYQSNWRPQGFGRLSDERVRQLLYRYGSVSEFINVISGTGFALEEIVREILLFHDSEELPNQEEKAGDEAESRAEHVFRGLSGEEKKKRAWAIVQKLKEKSKESPPKRFVATRYERGVAGLAMKEIYGYRCMVEGCGYTFTKKNGEQYAEAHHLEALSDGGRDDPANIVVLCPNHHRQFHFANVKKLGRTQSELKVEINGVKEILKFKNLGAV